jgi:hypothetical protein
VSCWSVFMAPFDIHGTFWPVPVAWRLKMRLRLEQQQGDVNPAHPTVVSAFMSTNVHGG